MNHTKAKTYLDAISETQGITFKDLAIKLNTSEQGVRKSFKYINSLKVSNHPFLKLSENGVIKNSGKITEARILSHFTNRRKLSDARTKAKKREIDRNKEELQSYEIVDIYHKNKACVKCKGLLELSRYKECLRCKNPATWSTNKWDLNSIPQEFIDAGW